MDFSTLVAGPAQAGPQSPVSKTGIAPAARAGAAPGAKAPAGAGFASLVAQAVDRNDSGATAGPAGVAKDAGTDVPVVDGTGNDDSPLEASPDAATLSLLIALATPAAAAPAPQPDATGPCGSESIAIDGDATGTMTAAPIDLAPSQPPVATATAAFADALSAATPMAAPANGDEAGAVAVAEAPAASASTTATPDMPSTATDAPAPAAESGTPSPTATAPAPAAAPRAGQKPAAHPLRQALAAIAATTPAATPTTETFTPDAATSAARPTDVAASNTAQAAASPASHEGRTVAVPRVDAAAVAHVAAAGSASDAGSAGGDSMNGGANGFAAASAPASGRGAEARLELPTLSAAVSSTPEMAAGASLSALAGLGANADATLRALDVPVVARFEQALSSVDPDVQNLQTMVRTVRLFAAGDGAHEARLQLAPEHLGPVALTVRVEQGSVSAHFRAETPAAQRWIETHQQELRAGLREQGLEVKDVVVTTDPDGRRERRQDAQTARPARARRAQTADAPRFEVLV